MNSGTLEKYNEIIAERIMVIQLLGYEQLFPKENRLIDYSPYFSSNEKLYKWAFFEQYSSPNERMEIIIEAYVMLETRLLMLQESGKIYSYDYKNKEFIVQAPNYEIHLKVLHIGDIVLYTLNRKTGKKGNQFRGLRVGTAINNMMKYL